MTQAPWLKDDRTYRCFYCDVGQTGSGKQRDPDCSDKNLLESHRILWSRPLPGGDSWDLEPKRGWYLRSVAPRGWFFDPFGKESDGFQAYIDYFFLTPLVSDGRVVPLYGDEVRFVNARPSGTQSEYLNYIEAQRAVVNERNQLIAAWWEQHAQQ